MGKRISIFDVGYEVNIETIEIYEYGMTDGAKGRCSSKWNGNICTVYDIAGEIFFRITYRSPRIIGS